MSVYFNSYMKHWRLLTVGWPRLSGRWRPVWRARYAWNTWPERCSRPRKCRAKGWRWFAWTTGRAWRTWSERRQRTTWYDSLRYFLFLWFFHHTVLLSLCVRRVLPRLSTCFFVYCYNCWLSVFLLYFVFASRLDSVYIHREPLVSGWMSD